MKKGTPNKIIQNLNKQTDSVSALFNSGLKQVNDNLKANLTPKQLNLYKAFSTKYIKLTTSGKVKEAEALKIKFENEQF